jgi:1-acyl-sn-glycerol-3-phosphate acyltransferase
MEPYVPELNFVYPEKPDGRMGERIVTHQTIVDVNYPYLDKSFGFRFMRGLVYMGIYTLVFFLSPLRFGLKIEGREILRKHRRLFRNGAMTASNHIHRWDMLFVLQAIRYRTVYFPAWKEHLNGPDENLIRFTGGIPIPDDIRSIKCFNKAFDEIYAQKKWIHVFPESSRFFYFQPIRPFKKGVFTMAYRYKLPVIPMAFSYRKPCFPFTLVNSLRALTGNQKLPMITLRIGEPVFPDTDSPRKEAVEKLRKECHAAIVSLAGIRDNPYPAEGD